MTVYGKGGKVRGKVGTVAGLRDLVDSNFQNYPPGYVLDPPWAAFTGMWGENDPARDQLVATSSMLCDPVNFPNGTEFRWNVVPDPDFGGDVNGFLHVSYGNYDWSSGYITPRQNRLINDLTVTVSWTFAGDPATGLLCECWLSSAAGQPQSEFTKTHEVGFYPKVSAGAASWFATLPNVGAGSFVDGNSTTWNVREGDSHGGLPFFVAYRPGYVDFEGPLPFHELFAFLRAAGKLTGAEWFNGVAFGPEPQSGIGRATVDTMAVTYTGAADVITDGSFTLADAHWAGGWYSGKSFSGGKARMDSTPQYDGINQNGLPLVAGKYYELTWTISEYVTGGIIPVIVGPGGQAAQRVGVQRSSNGTFRERLLMNPGGNEDFYLMPETAPATLAIDDVSLVGPYNTATVGGS